ncbi:MAG: hypothetical protein EXR33_03340 [Betaproteobacteria bacterium]|nr:hypothetical protein [Betaproteobacteria bacterium]
MQGIGKLPLDTDFYLFGKAGLAETRAKTNLSTTGAVPAATSTSPKRSKASFVFGGGIGYDFNRSFGLRLDYTRMSNVGDRNTGESDVGAWTAGLKFRF